MKSLRICKGSILLLITLIYISCKKDTFQPLPEEDSSALKSTRANFNNQGKADFTIYPSGDASGLSDFDNINAALQAAGTGDVVALEKGLYYLHKSIVKWNFSGTLRGAGMNKTTIQTAPGVEFDVSEATDLEWAGNWTDEGHAMFSFPQQYNTKKRTVVISDITFVGNEPTTPWVRNKNGASGQSPTIHNDLGPVVVFYEGLDNDLTKPINLNVFFENIKVVGEEDPVYHNEFGGNLSIAGLGVAGASDGIAVINNVDVTNATVGMGIHVFVGKRSTISIKDLSVENAYNGISSQLCHSWNISESKLKNCSNIGAYLDTYVGIASSPKESTMITDNEFVVAGGAGIVGIGVNNVQVRDNKFRGGGFAGVFARNGTNWVIADNNFCDFTAYNPASATIFLGAVQKNNKIEENKNQIVGGPSAGDPSNYIGESKNCY